jgi:PAS domain S-box-containing protein
LKTKILNLIDFNKVDTLLEGFNQSTGFVTAILDLDGNVLSKSGWRQICTEFHRINPDTSKKCTISDTILAGQLAADKKYHFYKCLNGLIDVAVPIVIKGEHIANLFSGQFFFEEPNELFFKEQAKKYGFDEERYLEALRKVPVISEVKVKVAMEFLLNMTLIISEMTFQKLEQTALNEELRTSEERYRLVLENSMDAILLMTTDGVILSANQAACAIFQRSEEDICRIGRNGIVDKSDPRLPIFIEERKGTGKAKGELLMLRNDGSKFPVELSSSLYSDESGQQRISIIIRDITERKLAEEALRENEERYRLISDVVSDYIFTTKIGKNGKLGLSWVTGAFERITGYSFDEYIAHGGWRAAIYPDDIEKDNQDFEELKNNNKLVTDVRTLAKDGRIVWVRVYAHPIWDYQNNELIGIYGGVKDVTESKLAENALANSEAQLHTLVQTIPDLIWLKDINGVYLSCNVVFERLYGAKEADIIGKTDYDFIDRELADFFMENDHKAIALGKPSINEEWITFANDGHTALLETTKTPMYNSSGTLLGVLGIGHDITERKQTEVALNKSEDQLRKFASHLQNVREEEKIAIAREIHDDLGQLLVALQIDAGLLKNKVIKIIPLEDTEIQPKFDNLVALIKKSIKTARNIMNDLRPELLEMHGLVGAAKEYLREFEERHRISCEFEDQIHDVKMTPQQSLVLFRILQEAMNNIVKHAKATLVRVQLQSSDNKIILQITDNGVGFDKNNSGREDSYGMIGMKERIILLEGTLDITSKVGHGTTVQVEIPNIAK